jgi:hypothetical protein
VTDDELRALVRDAIARTAAARTVSDTPRMVSDTIGTGGPDPEAAFRANVSFARLPLARGGDGDGACLIEPSVRCNHCGYCVSYGH